MTSRSNCLLSRSELQGLLGRRRDGDVIALDVEQHAHGIAHARLVLDQQEWRDAWPAIFALLDSHCGAGLDRGWGEPSGSSNEKLEPLPRIAIQR